jgi:tetratricopeptide (TPR) repeat protein
MTARILVALFFSLSAFAQSAAVLEKKIQGNPDNIAARVKLAEVHLNEGQFAKAAELLDPYTDQLPGSGFRALAFAYSSLKKYDDEVRVLSIIAKKEEDIHEWHMLLGQAYIKQSSINVNGDQEKYQRLLTQGIKELRQTLKLQPKYKPAFDLLLKTFIAQKANNEARELLTEGINSFGERPELFRELCRIDSNDGFLVQAVTNCSKSISISPNYPDHYVFLIQALSDQKEDLKAERQAVSAAKRFPKAEFVQWAAGMHFLRKKNYPVAARYFQTAVNIDPASGRAQFGLAQALFEAGKEKEALDHFVKACAANKATVDTFLSCGSRLKQRGDTELSTKYTQAAYLCKP